MCVLAGVEDRGLGGLVVRLIRGRVREVRVCVGRFWREDQGARRDGCDGLTVVVAGARLVGGQ